MCRCAEGKLTLSKSEQVQDMQILGHTFHAQDKLLLSTRLCHCQSLPKACGHILVFAVFH